MYKNSRVATDNNILNTTTITTNTTFTMLHILALVIVAVLGTQVITALALVFLFREIIQYICSFYDKANCKKAKAEATKGWGNW